ncbi:MCE family protein [Nocardioides humilatus]|uniref:MCE family protein n=1 Tax=Nocardioides humilatus TaxID=2607660 RepID=A0A5B1LKH4_9ACTN|nr:MCE family protein [Nocardioides humilatus]KAA1420974.1 MCE family protein [Nocardioides humilatus]
MKSFQSRNPIPVALIGSVVLAVLVLAAYNTDKLPLIGGGATYRAEFSNAAGIRAGNPVKVAGVVVGRVKEVELHGQVVEVAFKIDDAWIGDESSASVQLNTLLGQRYLAIEPSGDDELGDGGVIPLERTETPYDIIPAINKLSQTVGEIDVDRLATSLDALSDTFSDTPDDVKAAFDGLTRLSTTITRRNDGLAQLLQRADVVAGTVADRDEQVAQLIQDMNPLLDELTRRRQAIHALLEGTRDLGVQLSGLIDDNQAALRPALTHLAEVADVLAANEDELDAGIKALGPYVHLFTNTVGVGRWFDAYVCGLLPLPLAGANTEGCEAS